MTLGTILSFLRALPQLISLVSIIWGALSKFYREHNRKVRVQQVKDAIKKAVETKDTSALEKFFNPDGSLPDGSVELPKGEQA